MGTIIRSVQEAPPAHYSIKIKSFSSFLRNGIEKYESGLFEVGGYKWRLCLYPNGRAPKTNHVSLYLAIADAESLPPGWEVKVNSKMFVYDDNEGQYLTIQGANDKIWRFSDTKTEWGFMQLISLDTFNDASNGYLVDDSCMFGVELFVVNYAVKGESISLIQDCKVLLKECLLRKEKLSSYVEICSELSFELGYNWMLSIYPKGNGKAKNKSLSLYLKLADDENLPPGRKLYVEYKMAIYKGGYYTYKQATPAIFSASCNTHGFDAFFPLNELNSYIYA